MSQALSKRSSPVGGRAHGKGDGENRFASTKLYAAKVTESGSMHSFLELGVTSIRMLHFANELRP